MPRLRLYPPIWFVTMLSLQWVLLRNLPSSLDLPTALRASGMLIVTTGVVIFFRAVFAFKRHETTILPFEDASEHLIDSGVFRLSRNPIYLGETLMLAGFALLWGQAWPWLTVALFVWGIDHTVIQWEEHTLRRKFGDAYEEYCRRTRRWI